MPDVRPFRAVYYDQKRAGDFAALVAEPYDKVTEGMRAAYLEGSPFNIVRVDLPREQLDGRDRYATAASVFRGWLASGLLRRAERPALYLYEQSFDLEGERLTRRALVGLVEAREYAKGGVLPHERTFREPRADRFALLEAARAHFGMCFLLYEGGGRIAEGLARAAAGKAPIAEFRLADGTEHRVRAIEDRDDVAAVRGVLEERTCTIADGHHRYETAVAFRREHEKRGDAKPAHGYRLAAFVDAADPGLVILPTHRLLPKTVSAARVVEAARPWFEASTADEAARIGSGPMPLSVVGPEGDHTWLLPRAGLDLDRELASVPPEVRRLHATLLHKLILERGLGIEAGAKEGMLGYVRWAEEGLAKLRSGAYGAMVLLFPSDPLEVIAAAEAGALMPQKSTDFYPKLLSGLLMNDVEDDLHGEA